MLRFHFATQLAENSMWDISCPEPHRHMAGYESFLSIRKAFQIPCFKQLQYFNCPTLATVLCV